MPVEVFEVRENREELQQILADAVKAMKEEYDVDVTGDENALAFIYQFIRSATALVASRKSTEGPRSISLFNLVDIGVAYDANEDAEKEGNFVPFAQVGQEFKLIVKDDGITEE